MADVQVSETALIVVLRDGRKISAPLAWFPRLAAGTSDKRSVWEPAAAGHGIHWPLIDEDLSVEGLLRAMAAFGQSGQWFIERRSVDVTVPDIAPRSQFSEGGGALSREQL